MQGFLNSLSKENENLVICSDTLYKALFRASLSLDYLYDIKFKSIKDFKNEVLGYYKKEAIKLIHDNSKITYEASYEILNSFLLLPIDESSIVKDYYVFDESYISNYEAKNIIIYTPFSYDPFFYKSVKKLEDKGIAFKQLSFSELEIADLNHTICGFKNDLKEIEDLAERIACLLKKGVDSKKIMVELTDDSYVSIIDEIFPFYNINYNISSKINLLSLEIINNYIDYIKDNDFVLNKESFDNFMENKTIDNKLKHLIEKTLVQYETEDIDFFEYILSTIFLKKEEFENTVDFGNFMDSYIDKDSYYFIIGANENVFPKLYKESGLFTKETLKEENIPDSKVINSFRVGYIKKKLSTIKNLHISYKLKDAKREFSISPFLKQVSSLREVSSEAKEERYSKERDLFVLQKSLDISEKYHNYTDEYYSFINMKDEIKDTRQSYNPLMNLKDQEAFKKRIKNYLSISSTSLEGFYTCPYKYYLDKIISLSPYEVNYFTFLGNFFHSYVLNYLGQEYSELNVEKVFEEERDKAKKQGYSLSSDEIFFFKKFTDNLAELHHRLNEQNESCGFTNIFKEYAIKESFDKDDVKVCLNGRIDLLRFDEENNFVVIDYKTGKLPKIDLDNGIGMQLYIYLLLVKKTIENAKAFALFYHPVKKDKKAKEENQYKLKGRYLEDENLLKKFDRNDVYIKQYSKYRINELELLDNLDLVQEKIDQAVEQILSLNFKQTPSKNSCKYCTYSEICYMKSEVIDQEEDKEDESD